MHTQTKSAHENREIQYYPVSVYTNEQTSRQQSRRGSPSTHAL